MTVRPEPTVHALATAPEVPVTVTVPVEVPVRPTTRAPGARRPPWEARYVRAVVATDVVAIGAAVGLDEWLGFGTYSPQLGQIGLQIGLLVFALTVFFLFTGRVWDPRVLGSGSEEFNRLVRAFFASGVALALLGLATQQSAARPWVFGVVPLAALLAVLGRVVLRNVLHRRRAAGRCRHPVLAVGNEASVADLVARTQRDRSTGWSVTAACTPTGTGRDGATTVDGVPVVGRLDTVATVVRTGSYRAVFVAPAAGWSAAHLRSLAWDLEATGVELIVDPGLMEVAGPRLHVAPVDGLPMLRLTEPVFSGVPWVLKHVVDKLGAVLLIVAAAPLLLVVSLLVRLDGGPALFRQVRVGRHGREFTIYKFRTMVVDAEAHLAALHDRNDGHGPLFKLHKDPRVTPVGAFLRRYSIDEFPQLFNVLGGSMTLVGPRPPLPAEVATYSRDAQRKLLVRPGLTGLWQVSGRSDLSWEESVRLDLRYVENWSLAFDALILCRTVAAVVRRKGAY